MTANDKTSRWVMKQHAKCAILTLLFMVLFAHTAWAQFQEEEIEGERLAQTGMKFLSVSVDPRAAAMGGALTALENGSASMFYNPAGMAGITRFVDVALGQTQFIGNADYNIGSAAFRPLDGLYGVFGVSLVAVNYGEFLGTIRADNEQGFVDLGTFSPTAMALGVGYARALTDRFAVGTNVKYVRQSLGAAVMSVDTDGNMERRDTDASTVAVDFGVLYRVAPNAHSSLVRRCDGTGFRSLNFAVTARNFSREITYAEESFELPLTFRIGLSMNMMHLTSVDPAVHSFLLSVNAERPRDFAERVQLGGEYVFMNTMALRAGYAYPSDEEGVSIGAGLQQSFRGIGFGFDYAYTDFGILGDVNRVALRISL